MTPNRFALLLAASMLAPACTDSTLDTPPAPDQPPPGNTAGGQDNTFNHENDGISPWDLIRRLEEEGPPKYTSHVHSCPKVKYRTLGAVLASVGVNVGNTAPLSAGDLYNTGYNAMGGANFANRIRENVSITTSGASREFDIFAAAADEVIANLPNLPRCQIGGVGVQLFDATSGQCRADGITCLLGEPAQATHLDICNLTLSNATDPATGQRLAVAALLAAAYTCE